MKDSIIKDKASLTAALQELLNKLEAKEGCVIFKEFRSDLALISIFYYDAVEYILYFLAHKVAGSYQIAYSVVSAVSCYFFKHSKIPLFEISPLELIGLGLPRTTNFGTILQADLCDLEFKIFIQSKVVIIKMKSDKTFDFNSALSKFFKDMRCTYKNNRYTIPIG